MECGGQRTPWGESVLSFHCVDLWDGTLLIMSDTLCSLRSCQLESHIFTSSLVATVPFYLTGSIRILLSGKHNAQL